MLKFTSLYRGGLIDEEAFIKLFPVNVPLRVQLFKFRRGDAIDLQKFVECVTDCPYVVFPAFRLQEELREMFGGVKLWVNAQKKIEEQEANVKIQQLKEQFMKRKIQKQAEEYAFYISKFEKYLKRYNDKYYEKELLLRKNQRYVRIRGRRASDCCVGYRKTFNPLYEKFEDLKERKAYHCEKYHGQGYLPVFKERFHHSNPLHCERFELRVPDEINYH